MRAILNNRIAQQARDRSHVTQKAYQATHEDVGRISFSVFNNVIEDDMEGKQSVNYLELETCRFFTLQFSSASKGDEMLRLRKESIIFTSDAPDSPIAAFFDSTKTQVNERTYFRFERGAHLDI